MPVQISHLYDASQADAGKETEATLRPPAPRTNNLPVQPSPLVGREKEVLEAQDLIGQHGVRLLTLTGPGGMGKTRLGLQVAAELLHRFPHGVCFVPLAEITDPELVVSEIAQQLGVREGGSQPLLDNLKTYLLDKKMLLLLDNFEQVIAAAPLVADLLAAGASAENPGHQQDILESAW